MPWSKDSRGDPKWTSLPSTFSDPSECPCNPDMILIRVDLPAPLSPSTQVTSPAPTATLLPDNARIAPYAFPTSVSSISGSPLCRVGSACSLNVSVMIAPSCLPGGGVLLDRQVHRDREQQHDTAEGLEPVRVPARVDDALLRHAKDERTQ